ncbi:hypothetical protein Q6H81_004144 [Salmonella enterica]|nr:hypothetical protein [Salmonella enterica]
MNWPQITLIILLAFGLGVTAIKHGEPRNDKYSFWWQLAGNLVIAWLLWCGGFFSQAHAAQPPQAALQYRDDVIRNARLEWGLSAPVSGYNGGLGWVQRDKRLASQKGLDSARWFGHVETVNAGRSAANWRENRHYPQRILRELAPRYLTWGGSSCVEPG